MLGSTAGSAAAPGAITSIPAMTSADARTQKFRRVAIVSAD